MVLATDTVPGLACLYRSPTDAAALAACKGSDPGRPFSLHFRDAAALAAYLPHCPPGFPAWVEQQLPGPQTALIPRHWTSFAEQDWPWPWVGLRIPKSQAFLDATQGFTGPVLATSINAPGELPLYGSALVSWLEQHPEIPFGIDPLAISSAQASSVIQFRPLPYLLRGTTNIPEMQPGHPVLLLCSGNTCRSPLAAALLRRGLAQAWTIAEDRLPGLGWQIESAGTGAKPGQMASQGSARVALDLGFSLEAHRSRSLASVATPNLHILALAESHLQSLPKEWAIRAELLDPDGNDIADPFGGNASVYQEMAAQLQAAIDRRLEKWTRFSGPT